MATGRHLPYGITQCYLPHDTSEHTPLNPSQTGIFSKSSTDSIYLKMDKHTSLQMNSYLQHYAW